MGRKQEMNEIQVLHSSVTVSPTVQIDITCYGNFLPNSLHL